MSRAINILQEFPSNKEGIKAVAEAIVTGVMSGEADPLDVRAKLDAIEKIIGAVKEDVAFKDATLDQAEMYPDKTFTHNGTEFTKAESARYDYSDDEEWRELKNDEQVYSKARKEREAVLKTLKAPTEINGIMCHPPFKKATSYVRVKV